jgi:CDGSH-type Zn-finger protein
MAEAKTQIQVLASGPYIVKGSVALTDAAGATIPVTEPTIALCRCGHSARRPFCDGAHKAAGFTG